MNERDEYNKKFAEALGWTSVGLTCKNFEPPCLMGIPPSIGPLSVNSRMWDLYMTKIPDYYTIAKII